MTQSVDVNPNTILTPVTIDNSERSVVLDAGDLRVRAVVKLVPSTAIYLRNSPGGDNFPIAAGGVHYLFVYGNQPVTFYYIRQSASGTLAMTVVDISAATEEALASATAAAASALAAATSETNAATSASAADVSAGDAAQSASDAADAATAAAQTVVAAAAHTTRIGTASPNNAVGIDGDVYIKYDLGGAVATWYVRATGTYTAKFVVGADGVVAP